MTFWCALPWWTTALFAGLWWDSYRGKRFWFRRWRERTFRDDNDA